MDKVEITDLYGDTLVVTAYSHTVFLDAEAGGSDTEIALGVAEAKKLRKVLKKFIKEATSL